MKGLFTPALISKGVDSMHSDNKTTLKRENKSVRSHDHSAVKSDSKEGRIHAGASPSNSGEGTGNRSDNTIHIQETGDAIIYDPNEVERVYSDDKVVIKKGNVVLGIYDRSAVREEPGKVIVSKDAKSYDTFTSEHFTVANIKGKKIIYNKKRWDGVIENEQGELVLYKRRNYMMGEPSLAPPMPAKSRPLPQDPRMPSSLQGDSSSRYGEKQTIDSKTTSSLSSPAYLYEGPVPHGKTIEEKGGVLIGGVFGTIVGAVSGTMTSGVQKISENIGQTFASYVTYAEQYRSRQKEDLDKTFGFLSPSNLYEGPVYYGKTIGEKVGGPIGREVGAAAGAFAGTLASGISYMIGGTGHAIGTSLAEKDIRPIVVHTVDMVTSPIAFVGDKISKLASGNLSGEDVGQAAAFGVTLKSVKQGSKPKTSTPKSSSLSNRGTGSKTPLTRGTSSAPKGGRFVDVQFQHRNADAYVKKRDGWEPIYLKEARKVSEVERYRRIDYNTGRVVEEMVVREVGSKERIYQHINYETGKTIEGRFKKVGPNEVKGVIKEVDFSKGKPEVVQYELSKYTTIGPIEFNKVEVRPAVPKWSTRTGGMERSTKVVDKSTIEKISSNAKKTTKKRSFDLIEFPDTNTRPKVKSSKKGTWDVSGREDLPEVRNSRGTVLLQRTKTEIVPKSKTKSKTRFESLTQQKTRTRVKQKLLQKEKTKTETKQKRLLIIPPVFKSSVETKTKLFTLGKTVVDTKQKTKVGVKYTPISLVGIKPVTIAKVGHPSLQKAATSTKTSTTTGSSFAGPFVIPNRGFKIKKGGVDIIKSSKDLLKVKLKFIQRGKIGDLF